MTIKRVYLLFCQAITAVVMVAILCAALFTLVSGGSPIRVLAAQYCTFDAAVEQAAQAQWNFSFEQRVQDVRAELLRLKEDPNAAFGAIVEYNSGIVGMITNLTKEPYTEVTIRTRRDGDQNIIPEATDRYLFGIKRIVRRGDPDYPDKKQQFWAGFR